MGEELRYVQINRSMHIL